MFVVCVDVSPFLQVTRRASSGDLLAFLLLGDALQGLEPCAEMAYMRKLQRVYGAACARRLRAVGGAT